MISRYENITELDRETVFGLVESITVYEKDRSGENVTQEIRIEYRFIKNLLQKEKEDIAWFLKQYPQLFRKYTCLSKSVFM